MATMDLDKLNELLEKTEPLRDASIDFETRSPVNLKKCGPRRYAEEAEVLCMAYAFDGGEPELWIPGEPFPEGLAEARLHAWNAGFERAVWRGCCERLYGWPGCPPPSQWVDTQARAALAGLPLGLGMCAEALGLKAQKDDRGSDLIRKLSIARTGKQGQTLWNTDIELLADLYEYCLQDVRVEMAIAEGLPPIPPFEQAVWEITEAMNERGVPIDLRAAEMAVDYINHASEKLNDKAALLASRTFDSVSQIARLRSWLAEWGIELEDLRKNTLEGLLADRELPDSVREVLEIRQAVGQASLKKFHAVVDRQVKGRIHDTLRYHGAATGRWAGAGFQPQNIKRPDLSPDEVEQVMAKLEKGQRFARGFKEGLLKLSDCVRGVIRAEPGKQLVASDYSQIELRVLLWLAEDEENLQEIRNGLDPYKTMAASIFSVEYDEVDKFQRQCGKATVLGCGYQLGATKFHSYLQGYGVTDVTEAAAQTMVEIYRTKYQAVQDFWFALQLACKEAIERPGEWRRAGKIHVRVKKNRKYLELFLPSGRPIRYFRPQAEAVEKPWGFATEIVFEGVDTFTRRWGKARTYGGKLVENVTQGFARDIMAAGLVNARAAGLTPIMTVHDEVVCHEPEDREDALDTLNAALLDAPKWAAGLPLAVEGWTGRRYRK